MITTTKPLNPILKSLGITPEMILRHVTGIDKRRGLTNGERNKRIAAMKTREQRRAMGLNIITGQPLQRRPNGYKEANG